MSEAVSWPDTLPRPTFQGYAVEPMDSILRTEMESGPARQRRRYTQTPTRITVRWRLTFSQFALFESWLKYKAKEGGAWFSITLLGGLGMVTQRARFVGRGSSAYQARPLRGGPGDGPRWIVTSVLEVDDRPVLSEGALEIALTEDVSGLIAAIDAFGALVNQRLSQNAW